jgi:ATP-binding cassette subfamily B protein
MLMSIFEIFAVEVSNERLSAIEGHPVATGSTEFNPENFDISFDDVHFSYEEGTPVLNGVTFVAQQGQITALVGPSGSGKTTVSKLAARLWDAQKGTIKLGNTDVSTVDPEILLGSFSEVFQDVVLFGGTVRENIRLGRRGATDEEVEAAATAAQCDEFIANLPDGLDTVLAENGASLSGGERQRISIARALLKDAPVILLDEATASLDTESETRVQQAIAALTAGKTVLMVAHRMRTVLHADHIVVLDKGGVVEDGTPAELLAREGLFAHLCHLQGATAAMGG